MISDIWASYRRMPFWVQIWVFGILVPVNAAAILFALEPYGVLVATLSIGGMLPNLYFMFAERGFSRIMALPHLVLWSPLVILLIWLLGTGVASGGFWIFCLILLAIDVISLAFDLPDAWKWWRGARDIA